MFNYRNLLYVSHMTEDNTVNEDNIRVAIVSEEGIEKKFNMSASSSIGELKMAYSYHCPDRIDKLFFCYNQQNLENDDTPQTLGMKDDDVIRTYKCLDSRPNFDSGSCSGATTSQSEGTVSEKEEDTKLPKSTKADSIENSNKDSGRPRYTISKTESGMLPSGPLYHFYKKEVRKN